MKVIEFNKIDPQILMITSWNNKNKETCKLMKKSSIYRLICIEKGEMILKTNGIEYTCAKNDIFYLPPNTYYDTFMGQSDLRILNIGFSFISTDSYLTNDQSLLHTSFLFNSERWSNVEVLEFKDVDQFNSPMHISSDIGTAYLINTIKSEYCSRQNFYYEYINTLLKELLFKIARSSITTKKKNSNKKVDEVFSYIFANITESLSCAEIASKFNYHPNHLNRLVKENCGYTLNEYIKDKKIKAAISLLTETDESITYISYHLSFFDSSHFIKFFKDQTGLSPTEYRKSFKYNE